MNEHRRRLLLRVSMALTLLGWVGFMVSFWLPTEFAQDALRATALSLLIPGGAATLLVLTCWQEILEIAPANKGRQLRCTVCADKILDAAGTTIGDKIEGELMSWESPQGPGH